jgi:anti-sigma regulatory factor (Ser/Thr protein kinase)
MAGGRSIRGRKREAMIASPDDDVLLWPVSDPPPLLHLTLPLQDNSRRAAADAVRGLLALPPEALHDLAVVCDELVDNVLVHALPSTRDDFTVTVHDRERAVVLEVCDSGPGFSIEHVRAARRASDARGLGLFIVEQFADRWGAQRGGRFTVWAQIDID